MDYLIELDTLNTSADKLEKTKQTVEQILETFNSGTLSSLSGTEISTAVSKLKQSIERLKTGFSNTNAWLKKYYKEMNELEEKIAAFNLESQPVEEFEGEFVDMFGRVTIPTIKTEGYTAPSSIETTSSPEMVEYDYNGEQYNVVDTKISVDEYSDYLTENKMTQKDGLLTGESLLFSQYIADDLMNGTKTSKEDMADKKGSPAVNINERCITEDPEVIQEYVFNKLIKGLPIIIQVSQHKAKEKIGRNLVTAVGFAQNVLRSVDLTPENLLVLDSVDGKIQSLDDKDSELYSQDGKYLAIGPIIRI